MTGEKSQPALWRPPGPYRFEMRRGLIGIASRSRFHLEQLSKKELVDEVLALERKPGEVPVGALEREGVPTGEPGAKRCKGLRAKQFDMSKHSQRHVALQVAYIGAAYQGFAWQDTTADTVEGRLLEALTKVCLISDRKACGLSRGGRTDKGVSALGQVIALRVRSNLLRGQGVIPAACQPARDVAAADSSSRHNLQGEAAAAAEKQPGDLEWDAEELDYCRMLNRVLPCDIRVIAWQPVRAHFSARFSATHRTYKYFFSPSGRDVGLMAEAARALVGEHDFRNICKIDPSVANFRRTILDVDLQPVPGFGGTAPGGTRAPGGGPSSIWELTVTGYAFLWHQVRCIVALLFLVGDGKEKPTIIRELLDIERYPSRPQCAPAATAFSTTTRLIYLGSAHEYRYEMASDAPLLLYGIGYEDTAWEHSPTALASICQLWGEAQHAHILRAAMCHSMRASLLDCAVPGPGASVSAAGDAPGAAPRGGPEDAQGATARGSLTSRAVVPAERVAACPEPPAPLVRWNALAVLAPYGAGGSPPPVSSSGSGSAGTAPPAHVPLAQRSRAGTVEMKTKGKAV